MAINKEEAKEDVRKAFPGLTKSRSCGTCRFWEWSYEGEGRCNHPDIGKLRDKYDFENLKDISPVECNVCFEVLEMTQRLSTDLCDHFLDNGEDGP